MWTWIVLAHLARAGELSGGATLSTGNLGVLGRDAVRAGTALCVGGVGRYTVERRAIGGEASFCGNAPTRLVYGGPTTTWIAPLPVGYAHATVGAGLGWLDVANDADRYRAAFLYARPGVAYGLDVPYGAVEFGIVAMLPVPLVQVIGTEDMKPLASFASTGAQVTFLYGGRRERERLPEPVVDAEPAGEPVAVFDPPEPAVTAPMAMPARTAPSPDDERPLAIPAGAP